MITVKKITLIELMTVSSLIVLQCSIYLHLVPTLLYSQNLPLILGMSQPIIHTFKLSPQSPSSFSSSPPSSIECIILKYFVLINVCSNQGFFVILIYEVTFLSVLFTLIICCSPQLKINSFLLTQYFIECKIEVFPLYFPT